MSVLKKPAETAAPLHDLIRERWSPRAFVTKPVPADVLHSVLEAGRWAASSNNAQPWRIILATIDDPAGHATAVGCFNERNQRWSRNAPVLMFPCVRKTFEANGNPNAHAWYDTGAFAAQMTLQAEALGLRVHQAAGIVRDKIRATYAVPDEFDICTGIAMGYQGDPDSLVEDLPSRERENRVRKPLADIVFSGSFGKPAKVAG
ncbi:MAG: nitroreductase family protein [Hyphomicrobiaceae bacterium]